MAVATAVILAGVVVVAVGRGGEMAYFSSDYAPLDLGVVAATDVVLLRPPTSIWGYNIQVTDEALDRITQALSQRDIRIASLEQQVADLRAERELRLDHGRHTDPGLRDERELPGRGIRAAGQSGPGAFPDFGAGSWETPRGAGWGPAAAEPRPAGLHRRVPATRPHPAVGTVAPEDAPSRIAATSSEDREQSSPGGDPAAHVGEAEGRAGEAEGRAGEAEGRAGEAAASPVVREPTGPSRDATLADGDAAGPSRDATLADGDAAGPSRDATLADGDAAGPRGEAAGSDGEAAGPSRDATLAEGDTGAPAGEQAEHADVSRDGSYAEPGTGPDGDAAGA